MEYIFICILFTFIPVASEPDTCLFTPHSSRSCLEYWVPPGVKHGCIESTVGLEFAGLSHHLNGEALINLHHRGKNMTQPIWVRKSDGICENKCCDDTLQRNSRFLIQYCKSDYISSTCVDFLGLPVPACCRPPSVGFCCRGRDYCISKPCKHGSCKNGRNTYTCSCNTGYTGTNCDQVTNHCSSNPCLHGRCQNTASGHRCICYTGYHGNHCRNDCIKNRCVHGSCVNKLTGYRCNCHSGYTGSTCETVIDHCINNKCVHGRCVSNLAGYICSCEMGYAGSRCEIAIDHCNPNKCVHGTCHNSLTGYNCSCQAGYTGTNCKTDCRPDPCNGHGTCQNGLNGYVCTCNHGYTGVTCDAVINPHTTKMNGPTFAPFTHTTKLNGLTFDPFTSTQKLQGLTFPPFTSTPKLYGLTFPPFTTSKPTPIGHRHDRSCDKYGTLIDLSVGKSVTAVGATGCAGKSADALLIKRCSAPLCAYWKRGISVKDNCSVIKHYTPIGAWKGQTFTDVSGVFVSCDNGVIQMISQSCGKSLSLQNITSPLPDALYTIRWS